MRPYELCRATLSALLYLSISSDQSKAPGMTLRWLVLLLKVFHEHAKVLSQSNQIGAC
jgi:hypothetical protein